jgi:hypothetical protein
LRCLPACCACLPARLADATYDKLAQVIAAHPMVMLSTLHALIRARAEAEIEDAIYTRRLLAYQPPAGVVMPQLVRDLWQLTVLATALSTSTKHPRASPAPSGTAQKLVADPVAAGAAWAGFLISAQKYALKALQQSPGLIAWDVAAQALIQMNVMHVFMGNARGSS